MLELQTLIWTADLVYVHMYSRIKFINTLRS